MRKMQESYFDEIRQTVSTKDCRHVFVKLYDLGVHSDYGCIYCKLKTLTPELFETDKK